MSNTTLHPASQNFLVEISDACASPGTMWASVISSGNQGMSRLHVWVDLMVLPLGSVMVIGFVAIALLVTGAFSTRKWPVAPESEMACLTARTRRCGLKMVTEYGSCFRLFACTIVAHADLYVAIVVVGCK